MKHTYITMLLAATLGATTACTDDLDQYPHEETTSQDLYQTVDQYESVLGKLYAAYTVVGQGKGGDNADLSSNGGFDFGRTLFNLQEASTDEVASTWLEGDKLTDMTYHTWTANDPWVADIYYRAYYTIALCNEFLRHCADGEIAGFSAADQATLTTYRAEARFIRAYYYYWVLDLYRKGPMVTEADNVGAYIPAVADAQGLFTYIESELKSCAEQMPDRANSEYGRAPRAAAWMLLSRLYLNAEVYVGTAHYDDCIAYSQKVIDEGYELNADYSQLFNADNHKRTNEIIWHAVVDHIQTVTWGSTTSLVCGAASTGCKSADYNVANYGVASGWGSMRAQSQLPAAFEDGDKRACFFSDQQAAVVEDPTDQTQGYIVTKWTNLTDAGETASVTSSDGVDTDMPLFRLAEAYLNLAESVKRSGTGATLSYATECLNKLRSRAGVTQYVESDLTEENIFKERQREMYWENTRRTDLVRYGKYSTADYLWDLKTKAFDAKYNYFPIPQTELTANPNLSNPEY